MSVENSEFKQDFIEEGSDILIAVHAAIAQIRSGKDVEKAFDNLFRGLHTIKGGSTMVEYANTEKVTHELETMLAAYKDQFKQPGFVFPADKIDYIQMQVEIVDHLVKNDDRLPTADKPPEASEYSVSVSGEVLRVPLERVNSVLDNVWEVFMIRNQLAYLVDQYRREFEKEHIGFIQGFEALDTTLKRNISEVESKTMSMRMSTVKNVFQRMRKVVSDYSEKSGKAIQLQTQGENLELDKKVIDMLAEPLVHLVRNAMDHGIESTSEERLRQGKSPVGTITLTAGLDGSHVFIQIEDDGRGIFAEKVLASAQKKGLDLTHVKTDEDAINLIFLPGFSTAAEVTDVSGRGVGMDAVKSSVEAIGGNVSVRTKVGHGSQFRIRLPIEMSVIQALEVRVNGITYALNSDRVVATRRLALSEIERNGEEELVFYDEQFVPCISLCHEFIGDRQHKNQQNQSICLVSTNDGLLAIRVDEILQSTTLVTKPLPALSGRHAFISSVSLLQSGKPVFVLAMDQIVSKHLAKAKSGALHAKSA